MRKTIFIILAIFIVFIMVGCSKKPVPEAKKPMPAIDIEKVIADFEEDFVHDYIDSIVDKSITAKDQEIVFSVLVLDNLEPNISLDLADCLVRQLGFQAYMENKEFRAPGKNYYGELFDYYTITMRIVPVSKLREVNEWHIDMSIPAESHKEFKLKK